MLCRYRLYNPNGSEASEAHYAVLIRAGETIHASDGRKLLVLDVVPTQDESDEYVGTLTVEEG
jgi:hypothetical protein